MAFFNKEPNQLLIDLINEANPDVGIDLRTLQNTKLGNPSVYPNIRNQQTLRVVKAFTQVGTHMWTPPRGVTEVDILVVGGGGSGGHRAYIKYATGGGGAGGLVFIPNYPVSGTQRLTVGKGGLNGTNGGDTTFGAELRALGGGHGASGYNPGLFTANDGGSGGGSFGRINTPSEAGRAKQKRLFGLSGEYGHGFDGGYHISPDGMSNRTTFGGGGAGESATDNYTGSRSGGKGLCKVDPTNGPYLKEFRFADVFGLNYGERVVNDVWFAGGGGGGDGPSTSAGTGGGGRGAYGGSSGHNGRPGTGGGGGGGGYRYAQAYPGRGGDGIVLIAYNNPRVNLPGLKYQDIDTEIDIFPTPELPFKGKVTLYYRRINLTNFFKNREVRFTRWRDDNRLTTEQLLELYNAEFGTRFVATDFPATTFTSSNNTQYLNVLPTSYTYVGRLEFIWSQGERELDQILETDYIDGYVWDAKHLDEPVSEKPYLTFVGWGFDYNKYLNSNINNIPSGSVIDSFTPMLSEFVDIYNQVHGTMLDTTVPHTEPNGLSGLTVMRYSLPNTTVDEANQIGFNKVYVIRSKPTSWFTGCVLFHYDPK